MKKIAFVFLVFIAATSLKAQIGHDLTLYSEAGEKFVLMMNGKVIQEEYSSNLEMKNIAQDFIKAYIQFEDSTIAPINTTIYLANPGTGEKKPMSCVYVIKNKKGTYKVRFQSRSEKMVQQPDVNIIINN